MAAILLIKAYVLAYAIAWVLIRISPDTTD